MSSLLLKIRTGIFALALLCASVLGAHASVIYTYDFPGSPGSGLAANQSNANQPWAPFSDFTRTGGLFQMPGAPANNTYGTEGWNQTGVIDTTEFEGFSITAGPGIVLTLTSLSFDIQLKPSGPTSFEVGLFLNGSSTAYATLDVTPNSSLTTYTFDFTDVIASDNVTSASFKFFGWNAVASGGGIVLDNVITNGAIVPEPGTWGFAIFSVGIAVISGLRRKARRTRAN